MAKIDEERMLVRISLLIRDTDSISNVTFINSNLISQVGTFISNLYDGSGLEGLIVEVDDITSGWTVVNNASTTTTTSSTTTTTTVAPTTTTTTTTANTTTTTTTTANI
jgi:hypothetical protein